jgi:glyoxylase-like metal-dependent hydrolase (beta-lactamase superfamily II)
MAIGEVLHIGRGFEIESISVGPLENNVFFIVDRESNHGLLIDAADDAAAVLELIGDRAVTAIVTTHGHRDHHQAAGAVEAATGASVLLHPDDRIIAAGLDARPLGAGTMDIGSTRAMVLHTPGHTPGSICVALEGVVITGDTLFPGGPGATHFPYGSFPTIIESITSELFTLPDDTVVLPGHGKPTTIGEEEPQLDVWIQRGW